MCEHDALRSWFLVDEEMQRDLTPPSFYYLRVRVRYRGRELINASP